MVLLLRLLRDSSKDPLSIGYESSRMHYLGIIESELGGFAADDMMVSLAGQTTSGKV